MIPLFLLPYRKFFSTLIQRFFCIRCKWLTFWDRWKNFVSIWWLDYLITWCILLGKNKKNDESIFLFLESFSGQNLISLFFVPKSYSLDTFDKTTSRIISSCLTVCWEKIDGMLYPSLTTVISSECSYQ